jgi:hypothetical protein
MFLWHYNVITFIEHIQMSKKQELIQQAKELFFKIDSIPSSFETHETLSGLDRDWAFEVIDETQVDENDKPLESSIEDLISIIDTIKAYVDSHLSEIKKLIFLQYTSPKSVHLIMDEIGTKGVMNSENGLNIFRDKELFLKKKNWLVKHNKSLYVITDDEYLEYQIFIK